MANIVNIEEMSHEELDAELLKGITSIKSGKAVPVEDVDALLADEFGI